MSVSQAALAEPHDERRRHKRRSVYRAAELMLGGKDGVGCTILDESEGGLQLELAQAQAQALPEEVLIRFSDLATQFVRRCWARGNRAGFKYVEIAPAESPQTKVQPAKANFIAFNDFIHISRALLELPGEPGGLLYPAEQIRALLARETQARQLFPVLERTGPEWLEERDRLGPRD